MSKKKYVYIGTIYLPSGRLVFFDPDSLVVPRHDCSGRTRDVDFFAGGIPNEELMRTCAEIYSRSSAPSESIVAVAESLCIQGSLRILARFSDSGTVEALKLRFCEE